MATPYLDIQNLTKSIGDLVLFEDLSFSVAEGQHVGLIARNGAGKSTLLSLIAGKDTADSGDIVFQKGLRIGMLEQSPDFSPEMPVRQAVASRLRAEYASLLIADEGQTLQAHTDAFDADEEWTEVQLRAQQILTQLKITQLDKPIGLLSGGQQKRVALASVLIANPDLLILDEPTNHLDLEMIEWLEKYLQRNTKALLLVTHDRYFLDRVCQSIVEIDQQTAYSYKGNYAYYLEKRDEIGLRQPTPTSTERAIFIAKNSTGCVANLRHVDTRVVRAKRLSTNSNNRRNVAQKSVLHVSTSKQDTSVLKFLKLNMYQKPLKMA